MRFFKAAPSVRDPIRPADDINGEIPARALKFCEPFLAANREGYLLYPPVDFTLNWTGHEILADIESVPETILLDKLFLPDFAEWWSALAPPAALKTMPPLLEAFPERGLVQVWTGYFVTTDADTSTWIRGRVNQTGPSSYSVMEGLIETDWWVGPLFFVLQINRTDFPIQFRQSEPFAQVFAFHRAVSESRFRPVKVTAIADAPTELWTAIRRTAERRNEERPGSYRRVARGRSQK